VIDLHCHILPGLDDGPSSLEEALEMCRIAVADGIRTIVATPHMLNGMFQVDRQAVLESVQEICRALRQESIPLQVLPGADVHLDQSVPACLEQGELVTLADLGRHLLLELPQDTVPEGVGELLFQIQLKGVTPIITHPERNIAIQQNPIRLLESGTVHLVSTDAHNTDRRSPKLSEARNVVEEEAGRDEAERIFQERPARILEGVHVEVPEPLADRDPAQKRRSFWRRLFSYS
jgi:protein-tyrosine phosphatase